MKHLISLALAAVALTACDGNVSYVQEDSPANEFKDYRKESSAVVGVGSPISERQMRANAVISMKGRQDLEDVMRRVSNTYNVAVRWGSGARKERSSEVMISELSFNEARSYIEDVYDVQIVREGERRLLVLPSADEQRLKDFSPGVNVSLAQAVRGLADQCGLNLVITENKDKLVETTVTTSLKNVTCMDAFDAMLHPHGMSLADEGDYFTISGLPVKSWKVDLLEPLRSEQSVVSYAAVVEEQTEDGAGDNVNSSGGSAEVIIREERDLWTELELDLSTLLERSCDQGGGGGGGLGGGGGGGLLPPPTLLGGGDQGGGQQGGGQRQQRAGTAQGGGSFECGYVRINRSVGMVTVRAPQTVMDQADEIVQQVEEIAGRRLLVEARVLAVTRERDFQQGAEFAGRNGANPTIGVGFNPGTSSFGTGGSPTSITALLNSFVADSNGGALGFSDGNLDALVRMVEDFTTTYQMMSPSMEVMDRQRSTMVDGRNERFFVREVETIANNGDTIVNLNPVERVQFVGIQFSVSAQISATTDTPHTLHLQIPMTEIDRFITLTQPVDGGADIEDDIPIATTRMIDQKVRVRDNEIKVIGGLQRTLAIDRETGIPVMRGLPVVGKAMNAENIQFEDVEFVVLLQVKRLT